MSLKHYEIKRVGQEWCLLTKETQRPVAWTSAAKGSRIPPKEFTDYANEVDKDA